MKLLMLKKYLHKAAVVGAAALTMLLAACSGLNGYNKLAAGVKDEVRVFIAVGGFEKAAKPKYEKEEFISYKLVWTDAAGNSRIKQWAPKDDKNAYQVMNNEVFTLPAGTYTFVLTAGDVNGTIYKGKLKDKTVTEGSVLSFILDIAQVSKDGSGTLKLNVTYPADDVTKLVVKRYASTDVKTYTTAASVEMDTYTGSNITGSYSYNNSSIAVGAYIIEFTFYGGENMDIPLLAKPWLEYAYVTKSKTSSSDIRIDSFDSVYGITYVGMDGDAVVTGSKTLTFTSRIDVTLPAADTVTRTGYTFAGWYSAVDEDGNPTGELLSGWRKYEKTDDVTVYAKWIPNTYAVKFYTDLPADGALSTTPFATQTVAHDGYVSAPETYPTRTGYSLAGWTMSTDGTILNLDETTFTGEASLYAVWSYDVTFEANSDDATGEMEAETFYTSWLWTKSAALTPNAYELEGYSFLGWADTDDADEADYADGVSAAFGAAKTLYAVWHDDSQGYVVIFDARGGSVVATQTVEANGTATEPASCTKDEHMLAGWYISTDGGATLFATPYDFATPVTVNTKLYAKWIRNVYYVSTDGNDTDGDGSKEAPFGTISKALTTVRANGNSNADFTIIISGRFGGVTFTSSVLSNAKSLTIRGANGVDTDKVGRLDIDNFVPLIIENINVTGGQTSGGKGGGVYVASGSTFIMNSGMISGNKSYISLTQSGNYSVSNYAYGGGVYNAGTFIMNGGEITGNTVDCYVKNSGSYSNAYANAYAYCGGVYNTGSFIMTGGTVSGNIVKSKSETYYSSKSHSASCYGGGIYNNNSFTMTGGTVKSNTLSPTATGTGGSTTKSGAGIYNCNNFELGGAAWVTGGDDVFISCDYNSVAYSIMLIETLTAQIPVAKIEPPSYSRAYQLLVAADGVSLAGELPKFVLSNSNYRIDEEGKLASRTSYSITYKDEGNVTFSGNSAGFPASHGSGETTVLPVAVKTGYTFEGWYLTSACDGEPVTELTDENCTDAITLYAKWTARDDYFTITYMDAGGTAYTGTNSSSLVARHYPGDTETLVDAVKSTYVFDGWYVSDDDGVTLSDEPVTELTDEICTADLTLYAKWKPHYTVTYKNTFDGSEYITSSVGSAYRYFNEGETKTLPSVTMSTYVFDGWYTSNDDGTTLSDEPVTELTDENCTADLTLYAKWKPHYTVTYLDEGGEPFSGSASLTSYRNETVNLTLPTPTKTDFAFAGWYLTADGSENTVTSLTDENAASNITVYAKWIPYFTVTYKDRNGADFTGVYANGTPRSNYWPENSSTTALPAVTKDGFEFLGWYLESDCSGIPLSSLASLSGNITLYAWWAASNIDITVSNGDISITKTVDYDNGTVTLTACDGYTGYTWTVDRMEPDTVIEGAVISDDGKTLTFSTASLHDEHTYFVRVVADNKNGVPYSTNIQINK